MDIPHCPNQQCANFKAPNHHNWYIHYGYHTTKAFGDVPRFRCKCCNRTFSTQTFSIDYYAKKIIDYDVLLNQLVTASRLIDMSRNLKVRVECVRNRVERIARCTLGMHTAHPEL
jgi:transposase-like protein